MSVLLAAVAIFSGFLLMKVQALENKIVVIESRTQYWDMAVEILEDCMEYSTLGECKQRYPQYQEQFR